MLSSIQYQILLAIGADQVHGYAIMRDIAERTDGKIQILPGTLYSTIKKLLGERLIEECGPPAKTTSADERRRYYRLSARGREAATQETERLSALVSMARKKGFAPAR